MAEEEKIPSLDQTLKSKELSPLQKVFLKPVAKDLSAVFVDRYRVLLNEEIAEAVKRTKLFVLPGQTFTMMFKSMMDSRFNEEKLKKVFGLNATPNNWEVILCCGIVGILSGVMGECFEGFVTPLGGVNKEKTSVVKLHPNALLTAAVAAFRPDILLTTIEIMTLLKLISLPYMEFHEMLHYLSDPNLEEKYGHRFDETWTDFWVKISSSPQASLFSKFAHAYATIPLSRFEQLPFTYYERNLMESLVNKLQEITVLPRGEILKAMAQFYFGKNKRLLDILYDLSGGKEADVFGLFSERGLESKKIQKLKAILRKT